MQRECRQLLRYKANRKYIIMSSVTVGMCLSGYVLILVFITSVNSNVFNQEIRNGDSDLEYITRHHNRNLQNSVSNDDSEKIQIPQKLSGIRDTKTGNSENYLTNEKTDDKLSNLDNLDRLDNIYTDDEDVYKLEQKKMVKDRDNRNKTKHLPQAIIIGVKKAGTRALLEYLRMHPKVKAPGPEPHFFDKHYKKGLNWYRNLMPEVKKGQLTIEKTPSYFVTKGIPEKIYKMSKKTKLIIVFRDPVTRAISDYTQLASRNPNVKSFEEMVFVNNRTKIIDTAWTIVKIGVYAQHLTRWLEYFPLRQIHFVSGENLIENPAIEIKRIQEFLGLEQYITAENFTFNQTKGFPCYRKQISTQKWHCLNDEKGRQHSNIDPQIFRRLNDFYRPFNIKLYSMTGQDFGWT